MMGQAAALVSSASTVGVLFGVTLAIVTIVLAYALVFMVWLKWLMPVLFKQVEKTMRSL